MLMVRAFHRYQHCIEPISDRCDHGLQQILDYESSLRRYTLKMSYICSEPVLDGKGDVCKEPFTRTLRAAAGAMRCMRDARHSCRW